MAKRNFIPLVPSGTINADASVAQLEQDVLAMDAKVGELAEDIGDTEQEISQLKSQIDDLTPEIFDSVTNALYITLTNGKYVGGDGGLYSNSSSSYSNYIPVTGGATITINGVKLNDLRAIVAFDRIGLASATRTERLDDGTTLTGAFTAKVPEWARFVRCTGNKDGTMTGTETYEVNVLDKRFDEVLEDVQDTLLSSHFRAALVNPMEMTALEDVSVYALPVGYGVSVKPSEYMNAITTAVYVDGTNGNDANAGTSAEPLKTIAAALITDADTIYLKAGTYAAISVNKDINIIGLEPNVLILGAAFTGDNTTYVENIIFDGMGVETSCSVVVGANTEKPNFCANKCTFRLSATNGLEIRGEVTCRIFDCVAYTNKYDGFNYHKNVGVTSEAPNVLEVNCKGYNNGDIDIDPTSDNGSTAHNYTQIIRVNGEYHDNHGGNVADKGNVKSWNLGCKAGYSAKTDGDINNADFWAETDVEMYLEDCHAEGSTYDAWSVDNAVIHLASGNISNVYTATGGTVTTYTQIADVKYTV